LTDLQRQLLIGLVGVITKSPRQIEASIDTAVGSDATSRLLNSFHFRLVLRLVIGRHLNGLAVPANDAARVSGVSDVQLVAADERHDSSAPGIVTRLENLRMLVKITAI